MLKNVINQIRSLRWERLSAKELQSLMILSAYAAREFAESLRITLDKHSDSHAFKEMAEGELQTSNLVFEEYAQVGDHADFLWYFIRKENFVESPGVLEAGVKYLAEIRKMSSDVRVMSIVSREHELPGIFTRILEAKDWSAPGLPAFRYYLERHIALDSMEGGHADLLSGFDVDDRVADFYRSRLEMYRCIPTLFG